MDQIDEALGFYNVHSSLILLNVLSSYEYAVMFIGVIFDILLIIFIVVAVLLKYSLLLISVETKTSEYRVMRLIGFINRGFVGIILTQAGLFVLPAVLLGFILVLPANYFM